MCGINGFNFSNERLISNMNQKLLHRGPDGQNIYCNDDISLGHTRLSIIDLSSNSSQPLKYNINSIDYWIVYNGEVYNYLELRASLTLLGYSFNTHSDTEVILAAYIEWGEKCVSHFDGMWAFCIYDTSNNIFFISRDRLGVKPLYYYYLDSNFIFSSEIKAILCHDNFKINDSNNINSEAVELYFSLGYIPAPISVYNNVFKLENGFNLVFDLSSKKIIKKYKYFSINSFDVSEKKHHILVEEGKYLLEDSVKLRMRSDVPIGSFLSGGLDSSAIVGQISKFHDITDLNTFSIGFDDIKYDESKYINIVKDYFKTNHHHHNYTEIDFLKFWPNYSMTFDEPFGDYSSFPSDKVSSMANSNVKVVLSGDGGDEIFGGYPHYNIGFILDQLQKLPLQVIKKFAVITNSFSNKNLKIKKINQLLWLAQNKKERYYCELFSDDRYKPLSYQNFTEKKLLESLELSNGSLSEALRLFDLLGNTLSDNYLVKVDRTSMKNSIEVRSPFLDYRFLNYSQTIPTTYKVNYFDTKLLMRDIIKELVPAEILNRNKQGFTPPIYKWIYNSDSKYKFNNYINLLESFSPELFSFYKYKILNKESSYIVDSYVIKLLIFGEWYDFWINNKVVSL